MNADGYPHAQTQPSIANTPVVKIGPGTFAKPYYEHPDKPGHLIAGDDDSAKLSPTLADAIRSIHESITKLLEFRFRDRLEHTALRDEVDRLRVRLARIENGGHE